MGKKPNVLMSNGLTTTPTITNHIHIRCLLTLALEHTTGPLPRRIPRHAPLFIVGSNEFPV